MENIYKYKNVLCEYEYKTITQYNDNLKLLLLKTTTKYNNEIIQTKYTYQVYFNKFVENFFNREKAEKFYNSKIKKLESDKNVRE